MKQKSAQKNSVTRTEKRPCMTHAFTRKCDSNTLWMILKTFSKQKKPLNDSKTDVNIKQIQSNVRMSVRTYVRTCVQNGLFVYIDEKTKTKRSLEQHVEKKRKWTLLSLKIINIKVDSRADWKLNIGTCKKKTWNVFRSIASTPFLWWANLHPLWMKDARVTKKMTTTTTNKKRNTLCLDCRLETLISFQLEKSVCNRVFQVTAKPSAKWKMFRHRYSTVGALQVM